MCGKIFQVSAKITTLKKHWVCPRGVMVKAMDCGIVVSEFVFQLRHYVHFRANTLGKGMNHLILPAMDYIVPLLRLMLWFSLSIFHTTINWKSVFTRIWVTADLLRSPGHFWLFLPIYSFYCQVGFAFSSNIEFILSLFNVLRDYSKYSKYFWSHSHLNAL